MKGVFVHPQQKIEELWLLTVIYSPLSTTHTLPFNLLITRNQGSRKEETEKCLKCADLSWVWQGVACIVMQVQMTA